jgi:hypothetical protein
LLTLEEKMSRTSPNPGEGAASEAAAMRPKARIETSWRVWLALLVSFGYEFAALDAANLIVTGSGLACAVIAVLRRARTGLLRHVPRHGART